MSLLSSHPTSDSGLQIAIHPLVLLTISDYITRHTLRSSSGPIVGALLGQQSGRSITLEHAFECETLLSDQKQIILHETWFKDRLQQYKDVHKAPVLDLVGWFTTAPTTGPEAAHTGVHTQILQGYNETAVLLALHPTQVLDGAGVGGKLPLTIYESVYEAREEEGDKSGGMDIDGESKEITPLDIRFKELDYTVETGEAEMIGVDFVARGAGNATAIDSGVPKADSKPQGSQKAVGMVDEKGKSVPDTQSTVEDSAILSPADEELVTALTARANAVKMLQSRINLLKSYLTSLPPSYLTASADTPAPPSTEDTQSDPINHSLLRSISALLSRLPLLVPATPEALSSYNSEMLSEKSDVELVSLLATLGRSLKDTRELGRKFKIANEATIRSKKNTNQGSTAFGGSGMAELDEGGGGGGGFGGGRAGDLLSSQGAMSAGFRN